MLAVRGTQARTLYVSGSGVMRISPTGSMPSTSGASWSSMLTRVLGARHADALAHPVGEAGHVDVLAPDDARRVAVQEADQPDVVVRGAGDDILDGRGHASDPPAAQGSFWKISVRLGSVALTSHRTSLWGYMYVVPWSSMVAE